MTLTDELRRHLAHLDDRFKVTVALCDSIDEERELVRQLLCRVDPDSAAWALERGDGIEDVDDEVVPAAATHDSFDQAGGGDLETPPPADLLPPPAAPAPGSALVEAVANIGGQRSPRPSERGEPSLACDDCGKMFSTRQALAGHCNRAHGAGGWDLDAVAEAIRDAARRGVPLAQAVQVLRPEASSGSVASIIHKARHRFPDLPAATGSGGRPRRDGTPATKAPLAKPPAPPATAPTRPTTTPLRDYPTTRQTSTTLATRPTMSAVEAAEQATLDGAA